MNPDFLRALSAQVKKDFAKLEARKAVEMSSMFLSCFNGSITTGSTRYSAENGSTSQAAGRNAGWVKRLAVEVSKPGILDSLVDILGV